MSFYQVGLLVLLSVYTVDSYVTKLVSTSDELSILRDATAANSLLYDLLLVLSVFLWCDKARATAVSGKCFEDFEVEMSIMVLILDEDDPTHVFDISVPLDSFCDHGRQVFDLLGLVYEAPESYSPVTATGDEPSQEIAVLHLFSFRILRQAQLERRFDALDIVDGSIVSKERPHHIDLLHVFVVPKDDHVVTVDGKESLPLGIADHVQDIRVLGLVVFVQPDLLHSRLYVGGSERRRLLHGGYMIQSLQVEYANDSISTATEEQVLGRIMSHAEGSLHLDVHPLL